MKFKLIYIVLLFIFFSCSENSLDVTESKINLIDQDTITEIEPVTGVNNTETESKIKETNNGVNGIYTCYQQTNNGDLSLQVFNEDSLIDVIISAPLEGVRDSWSLGKFELVKEEKNYFSFSTREKAETNIIFQIYSKDSITALLTEYTDDGDLDNETAFSLCK